MIRCPNKGLFRAHCLTRPRGGTRKPQNTLGYGTLLGSLVALVLCMFLAAVISRAWARMSLVDRGDTVFAGFSGIEASFLPGVKPAR